MALAASSSSTNTITGTALGQTLTGTTGADLLIAYGKATASGSVLIGGAGDDTYVVHSVRDIITEKSGEGTDTVLSDWIYSLPAYVENLTLTGTLAAMAFGNAGNNIIKGNTANNLIDGLAGNDELTGGGGRDLFNVFGNDTIMDFGSDDKLNLQGFGSFTSFVQLKSAMTQKGTDAVLKLTSADSMTFKGLSISQLNENQFILKNQISDYTQTFADDFNTFSVNTGTGSSGNWYQLYPRSDIASHTTVDHDSIQYFTHAGDIDAFGNIVTVDPFSTADGVLTISMNPVAAEDQSKFFNYEYTSGMINSAASFSQTYGYFEIRTKLAAGQGLHDAFWMLPIDGSWPPELDIVEQRGSDPGNVITVAHAIDDDQQISYSKQFSVPTATTEFHTYGLDWEPDYLTWYIDGIAVRTMPTWEGMDKPMYMIANLGGGGPWAGKPNSTTAWPAQMQIDYIRAFASANTVEKGVAVTKMGTDGNDALYGTTLDDMLNGGLGDDQLYGAAGNDTLTGGGGTYDLLDGGFGDDIYLVLTSADTPQEGDNKGVDTVKTTLSSYTLGVNLEKLMYIGTGSYTLIGNQADNVIIGGDAGGTISASDGNDTLYGGLGDDWLSGGDGNDLIYGNAGQDTLRGNAGNDQLFGQDGDDLVKGDDGNDTIDGGAGNDNLQGGAGDDVILGGSGADTLDGGTGTDVLKGGSGNDTYIVDFVTETVIELAGEGTDTVKTRLGVYTLPDQVENLTFIGTASFLGLGNALANKIIGGAGSDTLDGAAGADTLTGASGDDVFAFTIGEADSDKVTDFTGAGAPGGDRLSFSGYGIDGTITQVGTSDFYTLQAGVAYGGATETIQIVGVTNLSRDDYVFLPPINQAPTDILLSNPSAAENVAVGTVIATLTMTDPDVADINSFTLIGDANGQFLITGGNLVLAKSLDFETAASHVFIVEGQDAAGHTFDKSFTLTVGDVNDTAPVFTSATITKIDENSTDVMALTATDVDTVGPATTFGIDSMTGDGALFRIEGDRLRFIVAPDYESIAHGPEYTVRLIASDGTNSSDRTATVTVADVIAGDTFVGTADDDLFVVANGLGYDRIDGAVGIDTLKVDGSIVVTVQGGAVVLDMDRDGHGDFSTVQVEKLDLSGAILTLGSSLASTALAAGNVTMTGTGGNDVLDGAAGDVALILNGAAGNDTLRGGSSADVLNGGIGTDTMTGGAGDDIYIVDAAGDVVTEALNAGIDTVQTTLATFVLGANVENLVYTGIKGFSGTGNALANVLTGGIGADRLDGLGGTDLMKGGAGNDTYVVDNIGDVVVELAGAGIDRVLAQVDYTLGDNIENLQLSTSKALNGTGNAFANTLLGNAGSNILDGRGGADILTGGKGDDVFIFRQGEAQGDRVTDFAGAGIAGGDMLRFVGYGTGAYLTQIGTSDSYAIHADPGLGGAVEIVQLVGVTHLTAGDYLFL